MTCDPCRFRLALERLTQAGGLYLDTEHRSVERELELRAKLGEALTDAAFLLRPADEK